MLNSTELHANENIIITTDAKGLMPYNFLYVLINSGRHNQFER